MAIACLLGFILSSALFAYPSYGLPHSARNDNKKSTQLVITRRRRNALFCHCEESKSTWQSLASLILY